MNSSAQSEQIQNKIPIEIFYYIISFLSLKDQHSFAATNQSFNQWFKDEKFWRHIFYICYPHLLEDTEMLIENKNNADDWYSAFRNEFKLDKEFKKNNSTVPDPNLTRAFALLRADDVENFKKEYPNLTLEELETLIDTTNRFNLSLLDLAILGKKKACLQYIYEEIVKPFFKEHKKDYRGRSLIHWTMFCDENKFKKMLKENPTDINIVSENKKTLLMYAVEKGLIHVVNFLLEKKVDVNARAEDGATALFYAAEYGHKQLVNILVNHGADASLRLQNSNHDHLTGIHIGYTPFLAAVKFSHKNIAEALLKKGFDVDVNEKSLSGATALMIAAAKGDVEMVTFLLANKVDINATRTKAGETAILFAVEKGHVEVVKLLLDNNATLPMSGNDNLIQIAIQAGQKEVVELLLREQKFGTSDILIAYAYNCHRLEIVKFLISIGKNANIILPNGNALFLAALCAEQKDLVEFLLKFGVNIQVELKSSIGNYFSPGDTPLDIAKLVGDEKLIIKFKLLNLIHDVQIEISHEKKYHHGSFKFFQLEVNYKRNNMNNFELIKGAYALQAVIFDGADEKCLDAHAKALAYKDLKEIHDDWKAVTSDKTITYLTEIPINGW